MTPAPGRPARLATVTRAVALAAAVGLAVLAIAVEPAPNRDAMRMARDTERPVMLAIAAVVAAASFVASKWEAVAAVAIALAATALGLFAAVQFTSPWARALPIALFVPAVLLWLSWRRGHRAVVAAAVAFGTACVIVAAWAAATTYYNDRFGPTHAASSAERLDVDRVEWVWSGALQPTSISVVARTAGGFEAARVEATAPDGDVRRSAEVTVDGHRIARLGLDGLQPDTEYSYTLVVDGVADGSRGRGTFRTPAAGPMSFRVAVAACARTGSNAAVFDTIAADRPLLYLQLGDLHYDNLTSTSTGPFLDAYDIVLTRPGQAALYRHVPVAYMWDDHDYGPSDSDAGAPGRDAARVAYRQVVPHYPVLEGDAPIQHAFTIGRVRFIVTDLRSERTDDTMLGEAQLAWFLDELVRSSRTHAVVVWASTVPWIGEPEPGGDSWAGYDGERRRIADVIAESGIDNMVMVAGDAHMAALDDGTDTDYSERGDAGFPLLHAAPLDRPSRVVGGPYTDGPFTGPGQYGLVEIDDDGGDRVVVTLSARNWRGETLATLRHVVDL